MAHDDAAIRAEMTALVAELAPEEGMTPSLLEGVAFGRSNRSLPRTPAVYEPCVLIVCQGRKRGYFGDQVIDYGAHQFMVASVPMPFEGETFASPEKPLLVMKVKLDLGIVADLVLALDASGESAVAAESLVSADSHTVSGSVMLTPASNAAARRRCCSVRSAAASSARELMPWNSASSPSTAMAVWPAARAMATASVR